MPARLSAIRRVLVELGCTLVPPRGGGSHWKATGPTGLSYPIPAHNGEREEISDKYIRGLCRTLGFDFDDFKGRL